MVKPFISLPNQKIRNKSYEVVAFDKSLQTLIANLIETSLAQTDPPALGLAAPQIDVYKRVFVALIRNKFKPFVNPKIIKYSKEETALLEGCFSVHGVYGHVTRPAEIDIVAQDAHGKKIQLHLKSLPAKIFQHEIDHLEGQLFIDHVFAQNGKLFKVERGKEGKETLVETNLEEGFIPE